MPSSKTSASIALLFCLNLLFFSLVTACSTCSHPITRPKPGPGFGGRPGYGGSPGSGGSPGFGGSPGSGGSPGFGGSPGSGGSPGAGGNPGSGGSPGSGGNNPGTGGGTCPRDALKLGVCAKVLSTLVNVTIGTPPVTPCCTLIQGLADLEAAICLCTAIRANILGLNINLPIRLSLLLNICSRNTPRGFQCP